MKKKQLFKGNRFLSLAASVTLLTGPLLVIACDSEINRYGLALPNDQQNRILFDFVGVNYSVDVKSQFSAALQQGMDLIKKDVEGIMAQQEFYDIFVQKLGYGTEKAEAAFTTIKDNLGLNILAADYFNSLNEGKSFDSKVMQQNKLIFQTNNWHLQNTTQFDYSKVSFYQEHNPDALFNNQLYENLDDPEKNEEIKLIAKHADDTKKFQEDIQKLTADHKTWTTRAKAPSVPTLGLGGDTSIQNHQKRLERFKWWLRFRYQQYYVSTILPQLNETLFTMANIFNSILDIKTSNNKPEIKIDGSSNYANQLQDWGLETSWETKYRWVFDYTVSKDSAADINRNWDDPEKNPLKELIQEDGNLNPAFFRSLAAAPNESTKNTLNPVLGVSGYVSNSKNKNYDSAVSGNRIASWVYNKADGFHYWGNNDGQASFAYSAPVYWIDVVKNLNFNYYNNPDKAAAITPVETNNKWLENWSSSSNSSVSNSLFSQFIRADKLKDLTGDEYNYLQELKWSTMWQMIYFLASQEETNPNKEVATKNFDDTAKILFKKYIKKENIYSSEFWDAVKSYY